MDCGIEQPLAATLGALAVAWILGDIGDQARIENALPVVGGIKAPIEVEIRSAEVLCSAKITLSIGTALADPPTLADDVEGLHAASHEFAEFFKHRVQDLRIHSPDAVLNTSPINGS